MLYNYIKLKIIEIESLGVNINESLDKLDSCYALRRRI